MLILFFRGMVRRGANGICTCLSSSDTVTLFLGESGKGSLDRWSARTKICASHDVLPCEIDDSEESCIHCLAICTFTFGATSQEAFGPGSRYHNTASLCSDTSSKHAMKPLFSVIYSIIQCYVHSVYKKVAIRINPCANLSLGPPYDTKKKVPMNIDR